MGLHFLMAIIEWCAYQLLCLLFKKAPRGEERLDKKSLKRRERPMFA